jgi:hypothetical protein
MSKLYSGGPYKQRDGSAITQTSTNVNTGGMKIAGTSNLVRTVNPGEGDNESTRLVGGVACGQADWGSFLPTTGITGQATGINNNNGLAQLTKISHGLSVGSVVNVANNATGVNSVGVYEGPHRVHSVVDAHRVVLNTPYVSDQTGITYALPVGEIANLDANNYAMRTVVGTVHGVANDKITSPASDYGRAKVHKVNAVRTRKVATAVRAGDWVPYSGEFVNQPALANDFAGFGTDEATVDSTTKYGLKGELAYRYGGPVPVSGEYEAKNG